MMTLCSLKLMAECVSDGGGGAGGVGSRYKAWSLLNDKIGIRLKLACVPTGRKKTLAYKAKTVMENLRQEVMKRSNDNAQAVKSG